jgi:hypothetical protein
MNSTNSTTTSTLPDLHLACANASIDQAQYLLHAAWLAVGALDREDHASEQDALRAVLDAAGNRLDDATIALERLQGGRDTP